MRKIFKFEIVFQSKYVKKYAHMLKKNNLIFNFDIPKILGHFEMSTYQAVLLKVLSNGIFFADFEIFKLVKFLVKIMNFLSRQKISVDSKKPTPKIKRMSWHKKTCKSEVSC